MMNKLIKYSIICFVFVIIVFSPEAGVTRSESNCYQQNEDNNLLANADNSFGLKIFKEASVNEKKFSNIIISPLSLSLALSMMYNGADGETLADMGKTLEFNDLSKDRINNSYKNLTNTIVSSDPDVKLSIANSLWIKKAFSVKQEFITTNKNIYNAEVTSLDFSLPNSKDIINKWVANKTNNNIKEIIEEVPVDAVMYLINAIYFEGIWKYEFDKNSVVDSPFILENGTSIRIPVMVNKNNYSYFKNELFQAVELPYGNGNFKMIIFLPDTKESVAKLIKQLDIKNWNKWLNGFEENIKVKIHLPKFKIEYENVLNDELIKLGMKIAFSADADFSGINEDGRLFISRVKHKSYIEVNEKGTEASAVSAIELKRGMRDYIDLNINRPFVFAITEGNTNLILFLGRIMDPTSSN